MLIDWVDHFSLVHLDAYMLIGAGYYSRSYVDTIDGHEVTLRVTPVPHHKRHVVESDLPPTSSLTSYGNY